MDTDVLGFYLHKPDSYQHLSEKIEEADAEGLLCTSIVTVEEVLAGKSSYLRRAEVQKSPDIVQAYNYLLDFMNDIRRFLILPFDQAAYDAFQAIPRHIRNGSVNDCRNAAIAISKDYTVVTNNGRDFERIRDAITVKVEYWVNAPLPQV